MSPSKSFGFHLLPAGHLSHSQVQQLLFSSVFCLRQKLGRSCATELLGEIPQTASCGESRAKGCQQRPQCSVTVNTPAAATAEFVWQHWNTGTLVQWVSKGWMMGGRLVWWGPFVFLLATKRMNCSAFLCLFVQTSCANVWGQQDAMQVCRAPCIQTKIDAGCTGVRVKGQKWGQEHQDNAALQTWAEVSYFFQDTFLFSEHGSWNSWWLILHFHQTVMMFCNKA